LIVKVKAPWQLWFNTRSGNARQFAQLGGNDRDLARCLSFGDELSILELASAFHFNLRIFDEFDKLTLAIESTNLQLGLLTGIEQKCDGCDLQMSDCLVFRYRRFWRHRGNRIGLNLDVFLANAVQRARRGEKDSAIGDGGRTKNLFGNAYAVDLLHT